MTTVIMDLCSDIEWLQLYLFVENDLRIVLKVSFWTIYIVYIYVQPEITSNWRDPKFPNLSWASVQKLCGGSYRKTEYK
jgi:hypothetical protein